MSDLKRHQDMKAGFRPLPDCPSIEELGHFLHQPQRCAPSTAPHVASCFVCQSELELMRQFQSAQVQPGEELPLKHITMKLAKTRSQPQWHNNARVWAAAACLLVTSGSVYYFRQTPPAITEGPSQILRTQQLRLTSPAGDLAAIPSEFRWEQFPGAATYYVQVMEVDRTILWQIKLDQLHVATPTSLASTIVPGKTLLWAVAAYDAKGRLLAASETQTFRIPVQPR